MAAKYDVESRYSVIETSEGKVIGVVKGRVC
jgi:hypothetical protein